MNMRGLFLAVLFLAMGVTTAFGQEAKRVLSMEQAVKEAMENNFKIKELIELQRAAVDGAKASRADLLPKLATTYTFTHLRDEPYSEIRLGPLPPLLPKAIEQKALVGDNNNVSWSFSLTQPVFTGFALLTKSKILELGVDLKGAEREAAELELARQVRVSYLNILLAKRALEVARDEVLQLEAHVNDAKNFYEQGVVPLNDLLKSQVALANAHQNKTRAESNLSLAISTLNVLLGRDISQDLELEEIQVEPKKEMEAKEVFVEALEKRPEIKALQIALNQAGLAIKIAKSNYFPQIYLVAQYERRGQEWDGSNNPYTNDHNSSITIQAKWNLFEWGKTAREVSKAKREASALEAKIRELKDYILLEVKQAMENLKVAESTMKTAREARVQAKENYRITELQYKEGVTTSTEVLNARTYLTQAETNYYRAIYGYAMALAELKKAVGEK